MLAIIAGIAVGIMVAIGGARDGDPTNSGVVRHVGGSVLGQAEASVVLIPDPVHWVDDSISEDAGSTRLVLGALSADGTPEPGVTAAAVEPTRDIVEPTVQVPLTVQPSGNSGVFAPADTIALIVQYDWPDDTAIAIADCESGFDPNAYNASGASGIFQFLDYWHPNKLRAGETWFDASANIRIAYETWLADGGFSAWNASRHCWGN